MHGYYVLILIRILIFIMILVMFMLVAIKRLLAMFSKAQFFVFGILVGWWLSQLIGVSQPW